MVAGWGRVGIFSRAGHRAQQAAHTASCIAHAITEKKMSVSMSANLPSLCSISKLKASYKILQKSMTNDNKSRRFDECQSAEKRESQGTDQTK